MDCWHRPIADLIRAAFQNGPPVDSIAVFCAGLDDSAVRRVAVQVLLADDLRQDSVEYTIWILRGCRERKEEQQSSVSLFLADLGHRLKAIRSCSREPSQRRYGVTVTSELDRVIDDYSQTIQQLHISEHLATDVFSRVLLSAEFTFLARALDSLGSVRKDWRNQASSVRGAVHEAFEELLKGNGLAERACSDPRLAGLLGNVDRAIRENDWDSLRKLLRDPHMIRLCNTILHSD